MGTTVKQKELDAQIFRICSYWGYLIPDIQKTQKIYKNVDVVTKAPPCFHLAQNGHFIEHG